MNASAILFNTFSKTAMDSWFRMNCLKEYWTSNSTSLINFLSSSVLKRAQQMEWALHCSLQLNHRCYVFRTGVKFPSADQYFQQTRAQANRFNEMRLINSHFWVISAPCYYPEINNQHGISSELVTFSSACVWVNGSFRTPKEKFVIFSDIRNNIEELLIWKPYKGLVFQIQKKTNHANSRAIHL